MYYTIKNTITYHVPSVNDALRLRKHLEQTMPGELVSFKYVTKYIKEKKEIVGEYQLVTATFNVDNEKEPEGVLPVYIENENKPEVAEF